MSLLRRWWRAVALTTVVSLACVALGFWQLDRREGRLARITAVTENYDAIPVPLPTVLPSPGAALPEGAQFTPVLASGTYRPQETLLVRNRPQDGVYGYLVLVPLVLDAASGGGVLVVDRGWVPPGPDGSRPSTVPAPPSGPVTVVVRLRPPEPSDGRNAPAGQVQRIDLAGSVAAQLADPPLAGAYGQLAEERPRPVQAPALAPRPQVDEGPHLGYSLQWFVFAAGLWAFLVVHVRRWAGEARAHGGGQPPPGRPRRTSVDEDAEDAALDAAEARR